MLFEIIKRVNIIKKINDVKIEIIAQDFIENLLEIFVRLLS